MSHHKLLTVNALPCNRPSTPPSGSGGCFPCHYDNPGPPNKRALTCLLYLNPSWKEGDGGEVCLRTFLDKEKAIAPLLDRLVGAGCGWVGCKAAFYRRSRFRRCLCAFDVGGQ